ncbi:MAG: L,D-transpeptidase family protein [Candidatus Dormibacteria bacterium]
MIAISGLRPAIVLSQVVLTFGAAQLAAAAAATHYQADQVHAAQAAIGAADQRFDATVKQVIEEGTPTTSIDPVVAQRGKLKARAVPGSNFVIDRFRIEALKKRARDTDQLTRQVSATETQVEVELHQQVLDAVKALRANIEPATGVGLDVSQWTAFADSTEQANSQLTIPRLAQATIADVRTRSQALAEATAAKVAADESARQAAYALQVARDGAQAELASATAALQRAKSIPVLKVADNEKAIGDLGQQLQAKLAAKGTTEEFNSLSNALGAQAYSLNVLVDTRQATYDLRDLTRRELDAAQNAKNDVSAERAQLDALSTLLDQAGDLNTFVTIKGQVQAIKNAIDAKYLAALYGVGKVIVVSLTQERLVALQDGVVVLTSLVTTGRPSMPTLTGTYHIFAKYSPYCMTSWAGNPYPWQGCAKMSYAMEWEGSGYFLHDAPWRSVYGPGTNTEDNGTHGCVNVPLEAMGQLYRWADVGTTVITKQGDLPG